MTNTSGSAAPAPSPAPATRSESTDSTDPVVPETAETDVPTAAASSGAPVPAPAAAGLAVLSLAWLAAMLWSGQRAISSAGADTMAVTSTALALPVVISASLVSGAATGLAVTNLLARRGLARPTPRFAVAVGAALLVGVLSALAVALGYGDQPTVMVLAGTIAAATTLGGAAGGLRANSVVGAMVGAGLAVFAVSLAISLFQDQILSLYGAGETRESQLTALTWYSRTVSLVGGLAAGTVAFGYLRFAGRRSTVTETGATDPATGTGVHGAAGVRWPGYLIAGAGPGLLLLIAEVLTRTAGSRVLTLAGALSDADRAAQDLLGTSRVDHALAVLFIGAFTSILLLGRTLKPADAQTD